MTEPPPPRIGTRTDELAGRSLAGRYHLVRLLASGGMAQVWEADDAVLARRVAVKILHPHLAADPSFVDRFRHEAIAAARLGHPSIVSIYDTVSDDGVEAIVMELVRGITLRTRLDDVHVLEVPDAVAMGAQVADALEVAHRAHVVHRDIKPANILLNADGRVMVADFGIAKAMQDVGDVTAEGMMLGTAKYLAPEQVEGAAVDGRTDLYSLGIVLYEALCGRPPFIGDNDAATALARLRQTPLRPRQLRASVPRPVEEVVLRAMARRPADRFASASQFRAALLAALDAPVPATLPPPPPSAIAQRAPDTSPAAPIEPSPPLQSRPPRFTETERSWIVPAVVVVVIAIALGIAGVLVGSTSTGRQIFGAASPLQPKAVKATAATAYDPEGDDLAENNDEAHNATDGDPNTLWHTVHYTTPSFGNLKSGVGIYLTLAQATNVKKLVIQSPSSGWNAAIYVADPPPSPATPISAWGNPVATATNANAGKTTLNLRSNHGTAVLLWITRLSASDDFSLGELTAEA